MSINFILGTILANQDAKLFLNTCTLNFLAKNSVNLFLEELIRSFLDMIYPVDNVSLKSQSIGMEYYELQRLLCPNPNIKIIELYDVNISPSSLSSVSRYSNVNNTNRYSNSQYLNYQEPFKYLTNGPIGSSQYNSRASMMHSPDTNNNNLRYTHSNSKLNYEGKQKNIR
jgi:hypothetical protein